MALNTEKYINVYYNKGDRKPYDVNGKPIAYLGQDYVGANEATIIRFNIGDDTGVVEGVADVKRPDGEKAFLIMTKVTIGTDVFYELPLTDWHTAKVGKLVIAFKAFDGAITVVDGEIQANSLRVIVSDIFNIDIGYSPNSIQETPPFDPNDLSAIIAALSTKLNKADGINVVQALPTPIDNSLNGRWYLVKDGSPESIGKLFVFDDNTAVEVELGLETLKLTATGNGELTADTGKLSWNQPNGTAQLGLYNDVNIGLGEDVMYYGKAKVGEPNIVKGQAIQFAGFQGDHILMKLAVPAEINANPKLILGIAKQDITSGDFGYVLAFGKLDNVDTGSFVAGDLLWFASGGSTAGALTNVQPTAPNAKILMAALIKAEATIPGSGAGSANNGVIQVRSTIEPKLEELQNVLITSVASGNVLSYDGSKWVNSTRLTTAETDIDALEGRMTTEEGNVDSLEGRMTSAEGDIDDIEDGTTIVPKALADQNGNVINTTYLTQSSASATYIPLSQKGVANGVVPLGSNGKVPSIYLSGEQDDFIEYPTLEDFPLIGESDIVYCAIDTGLIYRWTGSTYGVLSPSLALGQTSSTAFPGDRGLATEQLTEDIVNGDQALALKDQIIRNTLTTTIPLVVNSIASTTANLTEFQVDGVKKLEVTNAGGLNQNGTRLLHTTGTQSIYVGIETGSLTNTGQLNTAIGRQALQNTSSGNDNTGLGANALRTNTTGIRNTSVGGNSLLDNTSSDNSALGHNAGRTNTSGSNNTFVGRDAGFNASQLATATNSTAIGASSYTDKSNQMVFGNASVTEFKFDRNTSATALLPIINSAQHVITGLSTGVNTITQYKNATTNLAIVGSDRSITNGTDGFNIYVYGNNSLELSTNNAKRLVILGDGKVGIGTGLPQMPSGNGLVVFDGTVSRVDLKNTTTGLTGNDGSGIASFQNDFYIYNRENGSIFLDTNGTNRLTITGAGNVGIGTSSPETKLHIQSSTNQFRLWSDSTGSNQNATLSFSSSGNNSLDIRTNFVNTANRITLSPGTTTAMTLLGDGKVGIGTSSPNRILSVSGNGEAIPLQINNTSTTAGQLALIRAVVSSDNANTASSIDIGAIRTASSNADFIIRTDNTEKFRILNAGLVGINETSPSAQLQVKSGATTRVPLIVDTLASHTANLQEWYLNTSLRARINNDGFLGLQSGVFNLTSSNNSLISLATTGTTISRNIADTNPALITNLANASATGNIQVWQKAGTAQSWVNGLGEVVTGAILNKASFQNALITLGDTGTTIARDVNDANIALTINKNAGTGKISSWQFAGVEKAYVEIDGDIFNTNGTYGTISDERLKENIVDARDYTEDLMKLRVVKYSFKEDKKDKPTHLGFIAQEVEEVFPNLVETTQTKELEDMKAIKMSVLIPMLVKIIQEQEKRIKDLEEKL